MAILLANFNQYWQTKANTDQKLVLQKPRQQAIILSYTSKKEEVQRATPEPPEPEEVIQERACILASDIGLPYEWAETIVRLRNYHRLKSIPASSWEEIETACSMLYDNNFALLKAIIAHKWSLHDIYGCNPDTPVTSFNVKGLVLLLNPTDAIIGIREECIKIRSKSGSINSFYKRIEQNVKCVLLCNIIIIQN
jgi:hypothetical protein